MNKPIGFSECFSWRTKHNVFVICLLPSVCSIALIISANSFSSVTAIYEYNDLDRVGVVGCETSFTEVYPR